MPAKSLTSSVVLVLGDINVDILARIDSFAGLGGDYLVPRLEQHCGGVGANVASALAKWGVPVRLLGCAGRDPFADLALDFLQRAGVDISSVQRTERAMTGLFFIAISADGQRTMFGSRGANELLAASLDWACLEGVRAVHLVGYSFLSPSAAELSELLLEKAHRRGAWVSLDVGMAPSREIPGVILQAARKADILFVTLEEATALTGQPDKRDAFGALEQSGIRELILKLGDRGCVFREQGELREAPAFPVSAADTTGAGDAFAAAFVRARLHGWTKPEAALLANAAGAAASSVVGAGEAMPEPQQVLSLLQASRLAAPWEALRSRVLQRLGEELSLGE